MAKQTKAELKALQQAEDRDRAIIRLREMLTHGQTIYTVCRYVGGGRCTAIFAVLVVTAEGTIKNISASVSDALMLKWDDCDGVWSNSAFDIVHELSLTLHGRKNKGRIPPSLCHPIATPKRFKAGYTFEHKSL